MLILSPGRRDFFYFKIMNTYSRGIKYHSLHRWKRISILRNPESSVSNKFCSWSRNLIMHIYTQSVKAMALLKVMQILLNGLEKMKKKKGWYLYLLLLFKCSQIHFYRHYDCGLTGVIISHFTNRTHQLVHYQSTPWGGWVADYKMSTGHTQTKLIENPVVNLNLSCFLHLHKFLH